MSDWPIVRLGDNCSKIGSGATPRGGASVYIDEGEICLIRSQNIYNDGFKENGLVYITKESADKLKNVIVERNDVLLNITGDSVARVCLVDENYLPARVNQHVAIIRPDPNEFDPRYVRYLLTSPAMQNLLLTIAAVGATRNALTKNMIETLEVSKPPLQVQVVIADKLESLDNKIELNRQTNHTLEQIAQSIFKSWFVDFDPVKAKIAAKQNSQNPELAAMCTISGKTEEQLKGLYDAALQQLKTTAALFPDALVESELGEIPEGWKFSELKTLTVKISKGTTPSKTQIDGADDQESIPFLKVRDISNDGEITRTGLDKIPESVHLGALKRSVLETNDVLFSIAGTIGRVAIVEEDLNNSNSNQAIAFIRLKEPTKYLELCKLNLIGSRVQDEVVSKVVQGVQANFSLTGLGEIKILLPTKKLLDEFNGNIISIGVKQRLLLSENRKLAELRNTLLPKLLSGEITLDKTKSIVEAVA